MRAIQLDYQSGWYDDFSVVINKMLDEQDSLKLSEKAIDLAVRLVDPFTGNMNIGSREATVFAKWMGALSRIGALETGKNFYDDAGFLYLFRTNTLCFLQGWIHFLVRTICEKFLFLVEIRRAKDFETFGCNDVAALKHKKNSVCVLKVRRTAAEQHYPRSAWGGPTSMGSRHSSGSFYKPDFAWYVDPRFTIVIAVKLTFFKRLA